MEDGVMYAWQVVGDWNEYVHFTCARRETAEYLRDLLQAHEENSWRDTSKSCSMEYEPNSGREQEFSIQECEVIL